MANREQVPIKHLSGIGDFLMAEKVRSKHGESVAPLGFKIVLYMRYNRAKPLNPAIAFWVVARPKRLRGLRVLELE